jgi:RNA polymerase sigma factor (sigma-70 family)
MDDLMKLVRTYRLTGALDQRLSLADALFRMIVPDLRFFVFSAVPHHAADDVLQETLKGIAASLKKFEGDTKNAFWAWCYRIARNKTSDYFRKEEGNRLEIMPPDDLLQMIESAQPSSGIPAQERHDLEYAVGLLRKAKPDCFEFLWKHYVIGLAYAEIATEHNLQYDNVRMKITRCLSEAQSLMS